MQNHLNKIEELIELLKNYAVKNIELIKLETIDRSSALLSNLISGLIIGMIVFLFALFLSLGIGFYLSDLFENYYLGFGIVAGVYLVIVVVLSIGRKKILTNPMREKILHQMFQSK